MFGCWKNTFGSRSKCILLVAISSGLATYIILDTLYVPTHPTDKARAEYISSVWTGLKSALVPWHREEPVEANTSRVEEENLYIVSAVNFTRDGPLPQDLLKIGPIPFLPKYKNPCWAETIQKDKIACFPYFFLAGFPKAGTTDVFRRLTKHPEIARVVSKEPHWFTRRRYGGGENGVISRYLTVFSRAVKDIRKSVLPSGYHKMIVGDCSASTIWDNNHWTIFPENEGLSEPKYTTADYIYHINPKTKFIVMIRDPIERLYSDYLYFGNYQNMQVFHDSVNATIREMRFCLQSHPLRYCTYRKIHTSYRVRLAIGLYHVYIEDYLRVFPRQQMLMIKMENYAKDLAKYVRKIFDFLGLSPVTSKQMEYIADDSKKANSRSKKNQALGDMLPKTRKLLQDFYEPYNERLVEVLGDEFDYNVHKFGKRSSRHTSNRNVSHGTINKNRHRLK